MNGVKASEVVECPRCHLLIHGYAVGPTLHAHYNSTSLDAKPETIDKSV